ncbi:MAG: hypothetical protein GY903_14655 [Fuerstiella sp.]|nr:hypothetical protein [Fuerstiella sp.]MCP4855726.1 hypothetical protein [Fuerstiella sp.]
MRQLFSLFLSTAMCCVLAGCGDAGGDGHASDPTPGGEDTPAMEELESDEDFDNYAEQQGAGGN